MSITQITTQRVYYMTHLEDGDIEIHPDAVLLSQVVPELTTLMVQLQHRQDVCLRICFYCTICCLNFLCPLQTTKSWHDKLC